MRSSLFSRLPPRGALIVAVLLATLSCEKVNVTAVDPARVDLQPQTASLAITETTRLSAIVRSSDGQTLTGRTIEWSSLNASIATVDNTGMVRGMALGVATIRAATGGASGTATVTVTAAPSITLGSTQVTFTGVVNGTPPGDRTVAITNGGTGTLSGLSATVRYQAGQPTGWLTASLAGTSGPTTLVLSANQRQNVIGTYNAIVDIASSTTGVATRSLPVTLTVISPSPAIGLGANTIVFTGAQNSPSPAPQQVGVTNAGGGSLTGLATTIDYQAGQPTGWLNASLSGTTAPVTLTVRATTGTLAPGNYTANVRVTSAVAQNSPQTVTVTFAVASLQTTLVLDQRNLVFVSARGGANPPPDTVQVTSAGTQPIGGLTTSISYGAGQPTGWASATVFPTTTPAAVRVTATTVGLPTGIWTATLSIAAPSATNSPQTVELAFNVVEPLLAPTGLSATAISSSEIDLAWTAPAGVVTRYRIERKTGAGGTYAVIDSVSTTSYQNTGLSPSTVYFYRVQACNQLGCSPSSVEANATTAPSSAPSNLTATSISTSQINLAWNAGSGTVGYYRIERKTGAGGTYAPIDSVANFTFTYQNSGLTQGTEYFYHVQACNAAGCGAFSNEANATTQFQVPSVPSNLSASPASSSQIDVSWTASTSGPVTAYEVQRSDAGGPFNTVFTGTATNFSDTGRAGGTQYSYQVRACNGPACSSYTSPVSATTPLQPLTPTNLAANPVSSTQIDVSWTASSGTVTAYELQRSDAGGPFTTVFTGTATNFSDTGRSPGTQYSYQVRACNGATACSTYTAPISATTPLQAPSTPTGLAANPVSANQIDVSWSASTGTVTSYELQRSDAGGPFNTVFTGTALSFSDTGRTPSTQYSYQVRACNGATACSTYSAPVQATTPAMSPPSAPTGLAAMPSASAAQVDLQWTAASGASKYLISRKATAAGSYAVVDSVSAPTTTYHDAAGLSSGIEYFYTVSACNVAGCSGPSNEASATTLPPAPASFDAALKLSGAEVDLTWLASAGATSYQIEYRTAPGQFASLVTLNSGSTTSFVHIPVPPQVATTGWDYRNRACNAAGCSTFSQVAAH